MKKSISLFILKLLLFIFIFSNYNYATVRSYICYTYPHLNFSYCCNHCIERTNMLYYKGITKVLNDYIGTLIKEGKLKNKKVEIQAGCKVFGGTPSIDVSQNRNGYFVLKQGDFNLTQMVRIINYFTSPNWNSFCYDRRNYQKEFKEKEFKTFNKILDKEVGNANLEFFDDKQIEVLKLGDLTIIYEQDSLFYYLEGDRLPLRPENPPPVKLKNRYLLSSENSIFVYENGKVISSNKIPTCTGCIPNLFWRPGSRWANLVIDGHNVLSYSYDKNKFYELEQRI